MKKLKNTKAKKNYGVKKAANVASCSANVRSWDIYIYWPIIIFFIGATFYILGLLNPLTNTHNTPSNVIITEEALVQTDKNPQEYIDSAKAKLVEGNIEDAIAELNEAIGVNANSNLYALRGEAYMQMGDYQNAMADFNSAIEVDNMNAIAFYDRSLLNTRLENYEAALSDINNALASQSMKPSDILSMRNLYAKRGQLNLWLKNWEGAIADYTNSLARSEGSISAAVYAERAEAYTAMGAYENAVNDYTSAIRVISEQIQAAATQDQRESQSSNAMSYFEKSAALNLQLGNIDNARNDLESAFAIAVALSDEESINRIQNLLGGLN